jgi:WD40 repeat protein
MTRLRLAFILLLLAPLLHAEDKPRPLKKLAEEVVKSPNWLALNSKGTEIAVCADADVQIRDVKTLKLKKTYRGTGRRAEFVLDDTALVVSGVTRTGIELLDRKSGESKSINYGEPDFQTHSGLNLLAYRGEGKDGFTLVVYDLAKKSTVKRWEPGAWVSSPGLRGFSSKGVLAGDCIKTTKKNDKTELVDCLIIWPAPFKGDPKLIECSAEPRCVALTPDGKTAALSQERKIDIWDLDKVKKTKSVISPLAGGRVTALAYSSDGKRLVALSSRNADRKRGLDDTGESEVSVYDSETLKVIVRGEVHASPCLLMVLSADGKRITTAGRFDNRLRLWGVE